jgi:hypothetical protein
MVDISDETKNYICNNRKLTELPELPDGLDNLCCVNNNIKYLSQHNCEVIKNIKISCFGILGNPISEGFNTDEKFIESLYKIEL